MRTVSDLLFVQFGFAVCVPLHCTNDLLIVNALRCFFPGIYKAFLFC